MRASGRLACSGCDRPSIWAGDASERNGRPASRAVCHPGLIPQRFMVDRDASIRAHPAPCLTERSALLKLAAVHSGPLGYGSAGTSHVSQWKLGPYSVCTALKPSGTPSTVGISASLS